MSRVTVRDLFAGSLAVLVVLIIGGLAALERTIPEVLPLLGVASATYFFRGVENGGLAGKKGNGA